MAHIDDGLPSRLYTVERACSFVVEENVLRCPSHPFPRPGVIVPKLPWSVSRR
jgi:hypothetical protein